jgi:autotransporter-associated beta strand protein
MVRRVGRAGLRIVVAVQALFVVGPMPASAADMVWVGNDGNSIGNFTLSGNWQSNTLPSWGYGNSLKFTDNQNSGVTTLNYNWGEWRQANDIVWDTTFPVSRTLSSSNGGGIGYKTRIENNSYYPQTMAMEVSGGQDGASDMQLNPVNGSLTISRTIYNDNEKDYVVWGSLSGTNATSLTLTSALGPNAAPQSLVDFTVSAGRFSNVLVNASQVWEGTTTVNSGSFITGSGVTLASSAIVVGGGTVATTSTNTLADAATLTVNSGRLSIGGNDTVASLSGTGGTVNLAAGATLTVGDAASTSYTGTVTGPGNLTKVGSGTMSLWAPASHTGTTTVTAGELKIMGGSSLADTSAVNMSGGTLQFTTSETIGSLAGTGGKVIGGSRLVLQQTGSTTFAGEYTGPGSSYLSMEGSGYLNLTGTTNSFAVSQGTVALNGITIANCYVGPGGTLAGSGTMNGGGATTTVNGIHSPGNSGPGVQTFGCSLQYSGASIVWDLTANTTGSAGTAYDQIVIPTSNLTFSGSTNLALSFNAAGSTVDWSDSFWNVNRAWTVYDLSGGTTNSLSNLFVGGSLLDAQGDALSPTTRGYFTTSLSGQDVMLNFVAVPEPATWGLGVVGVGLVAGMRRLRRTSRA